MTHGAFERVFAHVCLAFDDLRGNLIIKGQDAAVFGDQLQDGLGVGEPTKEGAAGECVSLLSGKKGSANI